MRVLFVIPLLMFTADSVPVEESDDEVEYAEPEYLDALLAQGRYEEFSRLMGIESPHLVKPRSENDMSDPHLNKDLFHGDIILTPQQREQSRQGINMTKYWSSKWQNLVVPYSISDKHTQSQKTTIENCITKWNTDVGTNCIKFIPRTTETAYAFLFPGNGCFSNLGRTGKQQSISISFPGCSRVGTILHEMNHCIGFTHEQNRLDRDDYIRVLWENIPEDWHSQYEKCTVGDYGLQGSYDYHSAMHYPVAAPGSSKPAFEVRKSNIDQSKIGQRADFTPTDKLKIRELYGCK